MTTNRKITGICTASAICCCAIATFVYSQPPGGDAVPGSIQNPLTKGKIEFPKPPQRPAQDGYLGTVVRRSPQIDEKMESDVAVALKNLESPADRLKHFERAFRNRRIRLTGWSADIESITTEGEASAVSVRLYPIVEVLEGPSVTVIGAVDEMYELKDGQLKFRKRTAVGNPELGGFFED